MEPSTLKNYHFLRRDTALPPKNHHFAGRDRPFPEKIITL
jgi:hypothetical protein